MPESIIKALSKHYHKILFQDLPARLRSEFPLVNYPQVPPSVFFKDEAFRMLDLIGEICKTMDIQIITDHVFGDHENLFIAIPPQRPSSQVIGRIEGKIARQQFRKNPYRAKDFRVAIFMNIGTLRRHPAISQIRS